MLYNSIDALKLIFLISAFIFVLFIHTEYAQVSAPKNLKIDLDSTEATLSWDAPGSSNASQYFVYKAYTSDKSADPSNLHFSKFDSTYSRYYTDDLSSVPASTPVVFYYVTAADSNRIESPKSNVVNTAAP